MATAPRRGRAARTESVEGDGGDLDDLLGTPPPAVGADGLGGVGGPALMEGLPQSNRASEELAAQIQSRATGEPVFPYPPELRAELRPYWLELVNSFPRDHFQVSDITLMKMYCQCAADIERQNVMIEDEGEIVIGGRGQPIVNPRCKARESNRATLLALTTKFRNQPASRQNTTNFDRDQGKARRAGKGAQAVQESDGLLAGGGKRMH